MLQYLLRATRNWPKPIDRNTHAALDYLTTSAFLMVAGIFWGRHRRAAGTALVNGLMVLGVSVFTDYSGSLREVISFRTHGELDIAQASMAAGLPILLGFANSPAAIPFQLQAGNEVVVLSVTDFEDRSRAAGRRDMESAA